MADLDYSPALAGWVPFGTVATATATVTPAAGDNLFVRYTTTLDVPSGLPGAMLTVGGLAGQAPLVRLPEGAGLAANVTVAAGGTFDLGRNLANPNAGNPARLGGSLNVENGGSVLVVDGQFAAPVAATGTIEIRNNATMLAGATLSLTPSGQTLPLVVDNNATLTLAGTIATGTLVGVLTNMDASYNPLFNGTLDVSGTIDNGGTLLQLGSFNGLSITGATILGGTVQASGAVEGVTIDGAAIAGSLTTASGATNDVTGTIGGGGTLVVDGVLGFAGTTRLAPAAIAVGAGGSLFSSGAIGLDIGAGSAVSFAGAAVASFAGASAVSLEGALDFGINAAPATIDWESPGGSLAISALGSVALGADTTFLVDAAFSQAGTLTLGGGTLDLAGAATLDTIAFAATGSALILGRAGESGHLRDFADGSTVLFTGAADIGAQLHLSGGTLDVVSSGGSLDGRFILERSDSGTYDLGNFNLGIQGGALALTTTGVAITAAIPCYAAGTAIETAEGPVAVERLVPGALVRTAAGALRAVVWTGRRRVELARHPRPWDVNPVRVRADAFGPGLPRRDLVMSPDHAVFVEGVLIPVRYLLNGVTVAQEAWGAITWHHLELASHDVILAEGLAAETYLDTGNRGAFEEGGPALALHPDFARAAWARGGCAPLVTGGETLAVVRRALLAQAAALGHRLTDEAGLEARPAPGGVVLHSRSFVPAHSLPDRDDHRRLGVAVTALSVDGVPLALDDPRLGAGWHGAEPGLRWTDGGGHIAVPAGSRVDVEVRPAGSVYWEETPAEAEAARRA